jgi:hypothetical protein
MAQTLEKLRVFSPHEQLKILSPQLNDQESVACGNRYAVLSSTDELYLIYALFSPFLFNANQPITHEVLSAWEHSRSDYKTWTKFYAELIQHTPHKIHSLSPLLKFMDYIKRRGNQTWIPCHSDSSTLLWGSVEDCIQSLLSTQDKPSHLIKIPLERRFSDVLSLSTIDSLPLRHLHFVTPLSTESVSEINGIYYARVNLSIQRFPTLFPLWMFFSRSPEASGEIRLRHTLRLRFYNDQGVLCHYSFNTNHCGRALHDFMNPKSSDATPSYLALRTHYQLNETKRPQLLDMLLWDQFKQATEHLISSIKNNEGINTALLAYDQLYDLFVTEHPDLDINNPPDLSPEEQVFVNEFSWKSLLGYLIPHITNTVLASPHKWIPCAASGDCLIYKPFT